MRLNKHLILSTSFALLVLGSQAKASSISLYGVLDGGLLYQQAKYQTSDTSIGAPNSSNSSLGFRSGISHRNFWGLKGEEDLGNGTKAIFQLESRFDLGTGQAFDASKALFGRKAVVGLSSDSWGTFTIGRQNNVADDFIAIFDPFDTYFIQAGALGFGGATSSKMQSSLKYLSPSIYNWQFGVAWAGKNSVTKVNENKLADINNKNWVSLGLRYANGPFEAGFNWDIINFNKNYPIDLPASSGSDAIYNFAQNVYRSYNHKPVRGWNVAASYDFGSVKLSALFGRERNGTISGIGGVPQDYIIVAQGNTNLLSGTAFDGLNTNSWLVGASVPVNENGKLLLSYQGGESRNRQIVLSSQYSKGAETMKVNIFSLGYKYELSKRTDVYGAISRGILNYSNTNDYHDKYTSSIITVGMQHRF